MSDLSKELIELAKTSIVDPRRAAHQVMRYELPKDVLWSAALLVVVLSTILTYLSLMPAGPLPAWLMFASSPFKLALFMISNVVIMIFALFWTGKAIGGQGKLEDFIALMSWLQAMMILIELAQTVIALFSVSLASLFGLAAVGWWLWATVIFTTEGHRFSHWTKGVMSIALAMAAAVAGLSLFISLVGFGTMGIPANV